MKASAKLALLLVVLICIKCEQSWCFDAKQDLLNQLLNSLNVTVKHQQVRAANQSASVGPPRNASSLVQARWRHFELALADKLAALASQLRLQLAELRHQPEVQLSPACDRGLARLLDGLASQELAAVRALDASASLPAGLLDGTLTELGSFDECLRIAEFGRPEATQYCSLLVKPALPARPRLHTICQPIATGWLSPPNRPGQLARHLWAHAHHFYYAGLRLGVCLPSSCSQPEVQQLLGAYLAKFELLGQVRSCRQPPEGRKERPGLLADLGLDSAQQCIA